MNFKIALRLASIYALSSVRAKRVEGSTPKGFKKSPILNIIISAVSFPLASILAYFLFMPRSLESEILANLECSALLIFLPSFTALLSVMYSLMFEFSQSEYAASTDMINWLPLGATEYVLGSALCTLYFTSPILSIVFGGSLGLAVATGYITVWVLGAMLGLIGVFLGAFLIEVVRALINRASATLYQRGSKSTLIARLLMSVILFASFSLMLNINVLLRVVQWVVGKISNAWFVPVLWPSIAIIKFLQTDLIGVYFYTALSMMFMIVFFWVSIKARAHYWVPVPVSIRLASPKTYIPEKGFLGKLGLTNTETALIRKDLRTLVRRKEMVSWITMPAVVTVLFAIASPAALNPTMDNLFFFMMPGFGILLLPFYLALVSIGQEGNAFVNLLIAPLESKQVARAKLAAALLPSICVLMVTLVLIHLLVQPWWEVMLVMSIVGFATFLEAALIGLAMGARHPDFTEVPGSRFITRKGLYLGMVLLGISVGISVSPIFLLGILNLTTITAMIVSLSIAVCFISYREVISEVQKCLRTI